MNTVIKDTNKRRYQTIAIVALILVAVEIVNIVTGRWLNQFSLIPRELEYLGFIFTSPFLHANLGHFSANFVPLLVLSFLLMQFGYKRYLVVTLRLFVIIGLLVWIFARDARHVGASGIIYGYFGYLLLAGFLSKQISLILISLAVAFFYGGMIWGVLPSGPFVSWESHLFGFIAGLFLAWRLQGAK